MVNINSYIAELTDQLLQQFRTRLCYVGLQGSYLRGEANADSDIDIMVVIDGLSISDLDHYRAIIESMAHFDKSCGFICSKEDLSGWNPLEICHLEHTTRDYYGALADLIPSYTNTDIRNFIKFSLNGLYHSLCHSYIHADRKAFVSSLPGMYKGVFFILQNLHYLRHREFIETKAALLQALTGKDADVLKHTINLSAGNEYHFEDSLELLFTWCQETLKSL